MRPAIVLLVCFAIGCGDSGGSEDSDAQTEGPSTTAASDSSSTTSAATTLGSSGVDESESTGGGSGGLSHGYVKLELQRGESQTGNPYVGTATVIAVLQYAECLTAFYENHPELRQEGPDGALIFGGTELGGEGWFDRLCTPMLDSQIECDVMAIVQDVEIVQQLTVVYSVTGALEGGVLLFGPLPKESIAECVEGLFPVVRVAGTGGVTGNAENGTQLWGTETFSPAEAVTNQGAPITIRAAVVGG